MLQEIEYEEADGIAEIQFDRPSMRNALNSQLLT